MKVDLTAAREVVDVITGGWRAQCLYTAVKLGIPDLIDAGQNTDKEISAATGADHEGVHRLMRLLAAMQIFEGDGTTGYRATPVSALLTDTPDSLREMCLLYGEEFYTAWGHAAESISTLT